MGWALVLNLIFALIELVGAFWTNSVAILSDALHDFGDAFALFLALILERKSLQKADAQFSYGYRRWSLLSALLTGLILLAGTVVIWKEALSRIQEPQEVNALGMMALAVLGILINGASFLRLRKGKSHSERMLILHFIEDLAGWCVTLVAALVMQFVDWPQIDSLIALAISGWIGFRVIRQMIPIATIFLQALPAGLNLQDIETRIRGLPEVEDCHHTHLWTLDGEHHVLTTHICLKESLPMEDLIGIKARLRSLLREEFEIVEVTIEFELPGENCADPVHRSY